MKTEEDIRERVENIYIPVKEDIPTVYLKGYKEALKWVLED